MKTWNLGESGIPSQIEQGLRRIEEALGDTLCTDAQPCGTVAYHDEGAEQPWRIADDHASETFGTVDEAVAGAEEWVDACR